MNIDNLKKEVAVLENEFKNLGDKLEVLAPFACPSDKEVNEEKISEYYTTKKSYEDKRKEINNIYDVIRNLEAKGNEQSSIFVNSFGEATKRNISNLTYEKQQNQLSREIMSYIR